MQLDTAPSAAPAGGSRVSLSRGRPWVWPALVLVGLYWGYYFGRPYMDISIPMAFFSWVGSCFLLPLLFLGWWLTRRGIPFGHRAVAILLCVVCGVAASLLSDPSMHGGDAPGAGFFRVLNALTYGVPVVLTAWTAWMLVWSFLSSESSSAPERLGLLAVIVLGWVPYDLVRMEGVTGDLMAEIAWRWSPKAEDLFKASGARLATDAKPLSLSRGDWEGFRGPERKSVFAGKIATDWSAHPPRELWRHRVGPAWSSFAVIGDRVFTQEQWKNSEATVCYDAATGKPIWADEEPARFEETVSGPGPRATPTFANGRIYALGATGILTCLDAATGKRLWKKDTMLDAEAKPMMWGMSSSPLVAAGRVVVFAGGDKDKGLVAYRADSGELAWTGAVGENSYSSPQVATLDDKEQVLFFGQGALSSFEPATGKPLWKFDIGGDKSMPELQPQVVGPNLLLVGMELEVGLALLEVRREGKEWKVSERWQSLQAMKPAYNDFVVYKGHVYGFDGPIFCCVDLQTGERRWKNGRYGKGQVLLLEEQGLLLVVTELKGDVVMLAANPEQHEERGRFKAIKGKTWNHPVIAHGRLFLRNSEEMACFEVAPAEPTVAAK
jgi:outer membrane protein assembly factor BamB